jgi:hypothetical protein
MSRRASISGIVDQADVTRPFCPRYAAHASVPFSGTRREHTKFPYETRFEAGMLLVKPGRKTP